MGHSKGTGKQSKATALAEKTIMDINIFNDVRTLDAMCYDMVLGEFPRSKNRELIANIANGVPPYTNEEVMTNNMDPDCRRRAAEVQQRTGWTGLGSSDAHEESIVGCCYTVFEHTTRDQRDLIEALRSHNATAIDRRAG